MNKNEKMLLLIYLMRDMRGAFPEGRRDSRLIRALELMLELGLNDLYNDTLHIIEVEGGRFDGRFFRDCDNNYDVLFDTLDKTFKVGPQFLEELELLQYPEYIVDKTLYE